MNQKNKQLSLFMIFFIAVLMILILLIFIFSNDLNINFNTNSSFPDNYVTQVIDGDTFQINTGEIVRLLCVDTPEKNQNGYEEAKYYLESLILNKEVILKSSITDTDKYLRLLRYVYVDDVFVNKMILNQSYGKLLIVPPEECKEMD